MNRDDRAGLRYLTVFVLLLVAAGVGAYFVYLWSVQPEVTVLEPPFPLGRGWNVIGARNLRLKLVDSWGAEAPPRILAASTRTQLAWLLLDVCRHWPDVNTRSIGMLDWMYSDEEVVLGPRHPFTRFVALGDDAVQAGVEMLRSERCPKEFSPTQREDMRFIDLALVCVVTGRAWRSVPALGGPHRRWLPVGSGQRWDSAQPKAELAFAEVFAEAAAWVRWYDEGMKTPLPPLIQYQLDHPISYEPEYYDAQGRPLHMDPKDLEGLPLRAGPLPEQQD